LSGVYNREKLNFELNRWIGIARAKNRPLSLAILDIDYFKSINDTYGHLAGDQVISEIASIMQESIRKTDLLARWGGDEFALLFPDTTIGAAMEIVGRIRTSINHHNFDHTEHVTCSFGVAQLSPDDDVKDLLRKADQMLYAAKSAGKDTYKAYQS
jgi:diguanylate cyclase (GGDEF)-like protein